MRIVVVTNEFPAISETFISNKVMHLIRRGHRLFVICNEKNKALFNALFGKEKRIEVIVLGKPKLFGYILTHPYEGLKTLITKRRDVKKTLFTRFCLYAINRCSPDIIHFEFSALGVFFLDAIPKLKGKKVVSCRGTAEKVKLMEYEDRKTKVAELFNLVDAIHCVSEDMRQTILPYCCGQEKKIFINFPSIDIGLFKRKDSYQPHNPITILSISRLTFQKGYLTGLLTVKKIKEAGIKFRWLIVGDGPQYEELAFHIHEMNLQEEVILAGIKSGNEIIELYHQADIYFLPSVYEGIANAVLEAMSMELPVVCTKSGGMDEVIVHNEDGFLAVVYNEDKLACLLLQLINNFQLRRKMGEAGRQKVVRHFNINSQIDKFEDVYNQLIGMK